MDYCKEYLISVSVPELQAPDILAFFLANPVNYDRKASIIWNMNIN
jgi:hypothetical protein